MGLEQVGLKAIIEGASKFVSDAKSMDSAQQALAKSADNVAGGAKNAGGAVDDASKKMAAAQKTSKELTVLWSAMGLGAVGALGLAVKAAADFEHQMSQVGAVSGATKQEMGQLSDTALRIGKDTSFSASQAAAAMEELAAQGISTTDIIGGAADATVALAAAGGTDLVTAATAATTAMNIWKLNTGQMGDVVNRLTGAANVSAFSVKDMTDGMVNGGLQAKSLGLSVQDTTTALAALSKGGFQGGAEAGTAFKVMLSSIAAPSSSAKEWIQKLGFQFRDSGGNVKDMASIIGELHKGLDNLNPEDRDNAIHAIFGTHGSNAAIALMGQTEQQFRDLDKAMGNTDASQIAKTRMDNLEGSFESLKGSLETIEINIGTKLIPILSDLAGGAITAANAFSSLPESTQTMVALGAAAAAATPLVVTLFTKGAKLASDLANSAGSAQTKLGLFAAGLAITATAVDLILQKTTGHGIMEMVLGDVGRSEMGKKALQEFNTALLAAGPNADKSKIALDGLAKVAGDFSVNAVKAAEGQSAFDNAMFGSDGRFFGVKTSLFGYNSTAVDTIDTTKRLEESTKLLAGTLLSEGTSVDQLYATYLTLPGPLREIFDGVTNVTSAYSKAHPELSAFNQASSVVKTTLDAMATAQSNATGTLKAATGVVPGTRTAFMEFQATLKDVEGNAIDANKAIDALIHTLADSDPVVIKLQGSNAFLNKELGDLKAKGDAATSSELARIKVLEAAIAKNDVMIDSHQRNQKAVEGAKQALELYMGEGGLAGLLKRMVDLQVPGEQQVTTLQNISSAFDHLDSNDLPGAITALGNLKETLKAQPAIWAAVAEAIGPKFAATLAKGLDPKSPEYQAVIAQMNALGIQIPAGVAAGINAKAWLVNSAAGAMINALPPFVRQVLGIHSPSQVFSDMGEEIPAGMAEGIIKQKHLPIAAIQDMIDDIERHARTSWAALSSDTMREVDGFISAIEQNIREGKSLTGPVITDLLGEMKRLVGLSDLPTEAKQLALNTIAGFQTGFNESGSLAVQDLLDLLNGLQSTATTGAAAIEKIIADATKTANTPPGGTGGAGGAGGGGNTWAPGGTGVFGGGSAYGQTHYWNPETNKYQTTPYTGSIPQPKVTPNAPATGTTWKPGGTGVFNNSPYTDASGNTWSAAGPNGSRWTDKNGNYSDDGGKTWQSPGLNPYAAAGNGLANPNAPKPGDTIAGFKVVSVGPSGKPYYLAPDGAIHVIPGYALGTPFLQQSGLVFAHRGEAIIPASQNPYTHTAPGRLSGGSGGSSFTVDLRGSQFTGTPQENALAIRSVLEDYTSDLFGRRAFLDGVRS